jgi:hypothetical protein
MRKFYVTLLALLFVGAQVSYAQQKPVSATAQQVLQARSLVPSSQETISVIPAEMQPDHRLPNGYVKDRCGFVTQMDAMKAIGYDQNQFEAVVQAKIEEIRAARAMGRASAVNYVIPVIFHVIHEGTAVGTGVNIPASQVYQQIDQLNKDFNNQSNSTQAAAAASGLRFCPVLQNPTGTTLAEPGIERISRVARGWTDPTVWTSPNTAISYINGTIKPISIWDPSVYVNIWVINFTNTGLLGYSTFPTAGLPDLPAGETNTTAGVVFLTGAIGSVVSPGTAAPYNLGRTVTHELGHFFGLYHTWGDVTTCGGTDYCADTPPCSGEFYSGVPACTAPTQCSGQRRMIEDYMDYSDDGCLNTFTQNQVDRMQAVMLSAPRRPKNPPATLCTPTVTNSVSFVAATTNASEKGTAGTCPAYTDYVINVQPSVSASGNATVNFSFAGTATLNNDYVIVGSSSVSYTNGETAPKGVTVRVYDDGAPESAETIVLTYTITGTGLVAGTTNTTHTITIADDDAIRGIDNTSPTTTLLSENFGTTAAGGALPAGWNKGSFLSPPGTNVFTANAVYGSATGFTGSGRVLHITNGNSTTQTNETAPNTYTSTSSSDYIALTSGINTTGYSNIRVTFDYACVGEEDVDGLYDFGLMRYSNTAQTSGLRPVMNSVGDVITYHAVTNKTTVTVTLPDSACANRANIWLGFEWINDNTIAGSPIVPFTIDNVVVTGDKLGVESVLNQSAATTQMTGHTVQYVSNTNKIIAQIANLNANVGCITSSVQQAGVNKVSFNYTSPGGAANAFRTEKVIHINPATPNTTATYTITLYYTTAELAAWGGSVSSLKILKVKEGTSLSSTLNLSNATILTTTVDDQRATKGYAAFTANITGGFSQFMLSDPIIIPVNLISFEARPNGKNILLNFETATENNNKGFVIERSTDGSNFSRIGWVNGQGTTNVETRYTYTDNFVQPNVLYYYRLRQTDFDGNEKLSEIRSAKIKGSGVIVTVSPNPASDQVKLFIAGTNGTANVQMINAAGQVIRKWSNLATVNGSTTLDVSMLASGMYSLVIITPEETTVEKLIIRK